MQEKLSSVPEKPGVYLFKDKNSRILYVGKAKGLRSRVRSYFRKSASLDRRKAAMIRSVRDFEYTVTENELEALVLEANLIKQYRPRYNILLRDDKSYPYLKLTVNEAWPRLKVVRRVEKDGAEYFGPYVPAGAMWNTLSFIRNNFRIRTCKYSLEKRMRPCMQFQIKRCFAPCAGLIINAEYLSVVNDIKLLLEGKNRKLMETLKKKMEKLSGKMYYEEAAVVRDQIKAIEKISESQKAAAPGLGDIDVIGSFRKENHAVFKMLFSRNGLMIGSRDFHLKNVSGETDGYLMKNFIEQFYDKEIIPPPEIICSHLPWDPAILSLWLSDKRGSKVRISVPRRGIKRKLVSMADENAGIICKSRIDSGGKNVMHDIAAILKLHEVPKDIGAFDVSNISGKDSAGAFVYWSDGDFRKERYRHIKMDYVKGPDDYSMMRELVGRTIGSLGNELPGLMIIDGGRGHLDAALEVLRENNIEDRDVIGVAKNPDRAFPADGKVPVGLEDGRPSSLLLKRIRDEAHRFAISYHKKLRAEKVFESPLSKIHGIGRKRRFELLRHFGSIDAIKKAAVEDIAALKGFNGKIAERVLEALTRRKNG